MNSKDDNNKNTCTNFECNSSINSTIKHKSSNKRLPSVISQFPENQADFTRLRIVPAKKYYSTAVKTKYNGSIKVFSDSIPRGIRMKDERFQ